MIVNRRDAGALRELRTLYNVGTMRDLTDGQLLERFATDGPELAELALSALVERHRAMVWSVCVAIVRDRHEAEDAFQATFLVLLRRARSLWVQDSLGPWLHQVACRTASSLRTTAIRRRTHEARLATRVGARSFEETKSRDPDRDAAIHEEMNRLPEKYRAPVVLCDLEGCTHQEAARVLGWPIGTVKSRQSQGRGLLRDRLVRRGLAPAAAGAIAESLRRTAIAAVPAELSRSSVNAVMRHSGRLLAGFGVSAHVLTLTEEVLRAMLLIRLRLFTVAALALGVVSGGAGFYVRGAQERPAADRQAGSKQSVIPPAQTSQSNISQTRQPESAMPPARLRAQQLATRRAKALYEIAKLNRELAELAVLEYQDVGYPRDLATVQGEITLAEADLTRSQDRLAWAKRMFDKKFLSLASKNSEELNARKARFALEQAQSKGKVLQDYTKQKTLKELRAEVEKAHADELAKESVWTLEKAKEIDLAHELGHNSN